ncbi:MAG: hypothetical protein A2Y50_02575 [Pseudomonadales bacterium RIFCSPLOWO2_12_59_9]|nr:MAG: hypothetical protein A2Y50_02575 [Pseudomonadales bacterium RIFCSPLOWO2_12_59_9]
MDITQIVNDATPDQVKTVLAQLLSQYLNPAFGALPKTEVELMMLNALGQLGAINAEPQVYELVSKLRVSRAKARGLIYNRELRQSSSGDLDLKVKTLLKRPLLQKDGELFVLEVDNPLVAEHLRARVQQLGYVSDGSFSPSLIKLGLEAICALIEALLNDAEIRQVKAALIAAGAPDTSFNGVLKATLKKLAYKLAADSGEALMSKAAELMGPLIDAGIAALTSKARELFSPE